MKKCFAIICALVSLAATAANSISSSTDEWTTTVKLSRGSTHTFWVDGLTTDTAIMSIDVEGLFKYKEDGETYEDYISASESTSVTDEDGNVIGLYVLLTPDDWDVDNAPSSVSFKVIVSGSYDEDVKANNQFSFHHSSGSENYPDDWQDDPEPADPTGSTSSRPTPLSVKLTGTPELIKECGCEKNVLFADYANVYYYKTRLNQGQKYYFGVEGTNVTMALSMGYSEIDLDELPSYTNVWTVCGTAVEIVPDVTGDCLIQLSAGEAFQFSLFHAVMPVRKIAEHAVTETLKVDTPTAEFAPGYMVNPANRAYDEIIDDCLFKFTDYVKGGHYVFRTSGACDNLIMRLYDKNGVQIKDADKIAIESRSMGDDDQNVSIVWTATAAGSASSPIYVGVCQDLDRGEAPTAAPVTLTVTKVDLDESVENLDVIPTLFNVNPFEVAGAFPSAPHELDACHWENVFAVAGRAGVSYRVKARLLDGGVSHGLTLNAEIYQLSAVGKKIALGGSSEIDPFDVSDYIEFTPVSHGTVYIAVSVADGEWGRGIGHNYGPYCVCAVAGGDYGVLKVDMVGAPQSQMAWKILKANDKTANGEVFYPAGSSAIVPAGKYTLIAQGAKGTDFMAVSTAGFGTYEVTSPETTSVLYRYYDKIDANGNGIDNTPAGASKLTLGKEVSKSLFTNDPADWYSFAAKAGEYYRFTFAEKHGSPKIAVYAPDKTTECEYLLLTDPESDVQICAAQAGTYYVKVFNEGCTEDYSYTLASAVRKPGSISVPATVTANEGAQFAEVKVSRKNGKDGRVRVKYHTRAITAEPKKDYYPVKDGVLVWENGDAKDKKVQIALIPELTPAYVGNRTFSVEFETFDPEDESFDIANEFVPAFIADKTTKLPVTNCVVTIKEKMQPPKASPGKIRAAGVGDYKKPVITLTAGGSIGLPLERVEGTEGLVAVDAVTVKGKALPGVDYVEISKRISFKDGASYGSGYIIIETMKNPKDYTASKDLKVKLTVVKDAGYGKPTLITSEITINIINDKSVPAGCTVKTEAKGSTFTFGLTGTFNYREDGVAKSFTATAKAKSVLTTGVVTDIEFIPDGEPETAYQGVKYSRSFGSAGTVKVANAPAGLKLAQDKKTKEWILAGTPGKAGLYQMTVTTTVPGAPVSTAVICYDVKAMGTAAGTFNGLATTFDTEDGIRSLAQISITAKTDGKLSATVNVGGSKQAFEDTGYTRIEVDEDNPEAVPVYFAELSKVLTYKVGTVSHTVTNRLYYTVKGRPESDQDGWGEVSDVRIMFEALQAPDKSYSEDIWYEGKLCRDCSKITDKEALASWTSLMSMFTGYYTVALVNIDAQPGEPQGNGYLTFTFDAKGKVKIAGMLPDGTSYTGSGIPGNFVFYDDGRFSVRVPVYACKSPYVFGGWIELCWGSAPNPIVSYEAPDTDIIWKNDSAKSTKDGYGFSLYLYPVGGWYDTVKNLQTWFLENSFSIDLPTFEDDLDGFSETGVLPAGYEFKATPQGTSVDVIGDNVTVAKQSLVKDASKLIDYGASVNAANVKLAFKRATGILSGTFDLCYQGYNSRGALEQKSVSGLKYNSILLLSHGDEGYIDDDVWATGFYQVPKQTVYDPNGAKRDWTGSYRFDIRSEKVERDWTER